ncbi:MAG: lytic transglycosylase domain-containing protein [Thermodesulfobacteriota bacterium]
MKIHHNNSGIKTPSPSANKAATQTGSRATFDACLTALTSNGPQNTGAAPPAPAPPDTGNRIAIGTISAADPTVSHLMADHPDYGSDCWQIIHSDRNQDKPYTQIPAGTTVYMEPDSEEITWEGDQTRPAPAPHRPVHAGDAERQRHVIDRAVSRAAAAYDLPEALIKGVIRAESDFRSRAVSAAGAQGLMQLMPATARELGVENPFDIRENIHGGTRYLKQMLDTFDGDIQQALAAYNAGPAAVKAHQGQIPYPETRRYVEHVLSNLKGLL